MKVVSLYAGADNLGDGVWQAGHEIILAVEYYPKDPKLSQDACETIRLNHPDTEVIHKPVGEILSTLPKCDAIIGGPPCPEFSNAKLVKDVEAGLCEVNNFVKAREITKAKYYLMENVEGLYRHHKQRNFLINCADYGVPQTRIRRIFTNLELPTPTHAEHPTGRLFGEPLKKWVSVRDALGLGEGMIEDRKTKPSMEPNFRQYDPDKPSHTLLSDPRDWFISIKQLKDKNKAWFKKHPPVKLDEASSTILTKHRSTPNEFITDGVNARKLTNEELAILQGFRTDFKFFGNKSSVRRQIGNAVPAIIGKRFFEGLS
jgi:DNA (cytosine-5)-methyltransferase 1